MKVIGIIPARYASTRFEGKPLATIKEKSMIEWVYKRAKKANLDKLIVATDDKRIYDEVIKFGGEVVMTSKNHETGTDRLIEACKNYSEYDVVINIQGDEPLIEAEIINQLINMFKNENNLKMATLKHEIENKEDIENPNIVKVISDINSYALYFSRSPIPYMRNKTDIRYFKHIGLYGYERNFLINYNNLKESLLEKTESLEQLRALENGYKIKIEETKFKIQGVDTKEDLEKVIKIVKENNIEI